MPDEETDKETRALLEEANAKLSAAAKEWTNKTIRREERGLELDTAKMQGEASRSDTASQAYVSALSSELTANINLRNETQNAIDAIAEDLISRDQATARKAPSVAGRDPGHVHGRPSACHEPTPNMASAHDRASAPRAMR